jgi:hypothetical protein
VIQIQQNIQNIAQVSQTPESAESSLIAARFQNRATKNISACQLSEKAGYKSTRKQRASALQNIKRIRRNVTSHGKNLVQNSIL